MCSDGEDNHPSGANHACMITGIPFDGFSKLALSAASSQWVNEIAIILILFNVYIGKYVEDN